MKIFFMFVVCFRKLFYLCKRKEKKESCTSTGRFPCYKHPGSGD